MVREKPQERESKQKHKSWAIVGQWSSWTLEPLGNNGQSGQRTHTGDKPTQYFTIFEGVSPLPGRSIFHVLLLWILSRQHHLAIHEPESLPCLVYQQQSPPPGPSWQPVVSRETSEVRSILYKRVAERHTWSSCLLILQLLLYFSFWFLWVFGVGGREKGEG